MFSFYGLTLKGSTHQIRCPFHGADRNPSCRYYADTQRIWCFACNEGGDVCWFVRKKEGFKTYEETFQFIREQFGVAMDELDLNKRRAILPVVQTMPQKELFAKDHVNGLNDLLLEVRRQGFPPEKLDKLTVMFWQRKYEIDEAQSDYLGYCNLIRGWSQWCRQLLQEAQKYNQPETR